MQVNSVEGVVANSRLSRMHVTILAWSMFLIMFDGFDLSILGIVIPILHEQWGIAIPTLGAVASLTLIGSLIGAFLAGVLADRFGRKKILVYCVLLFSLFTLCNAFATTITFFAVCRFVAGIGLGGIPPLVVALTTEYAPKKWRNRFVGIMFSGYSLGGIAVALLGIFLMPYYGWQSLFIIGALPLILLPILVRRLPESLPYLAQHEPEKMKGIVRKLNQDVVEDDMLEWREVSKEQQQPIKALFTKERRRITLSFWVICFMGLLLVYGLSTWLPQLMRTEGHGITSSISFICALNIGAILGSIFGGMLADRIGSRLVLITLYTLGAICFILLAFHFSLMTLYVLVAIGGAASIGAQNLNNACNASYYDAPCRGTALGAALSVGRLGAIVGPLIGGWLLAADVSNYWNYILFAIPACIAAMTYMYMPKQQEDIHHA
ncbi:MFS transporter [Kurthia senegalensis]|uniref:MFS transporter n=1 Tax=Kurthia senegalensis TaxID=1033740 RepID=UPI0002896C1D|nr:aromatic acid/H+ symport family MFS transporter [Kurthia senegalensis]